MYLYLAHIDDKDTRKFSNLKEAVLFDIDGDGLRDTIAILECGDELVPIVCMGEYESWGVTYCKKADYSAAEELINNVSDMTAKNVVAYYRGNQDENTSGIAGVKAAFDGAKTMTLADTDFCVNYKGKVFGPVMQWSDFTTALGYPKNYEDNNFGFISSEDGYRWELRYPASSETPYDFRVVLVSPSMEREGTDTFIDFIGLDQTPTYRDVKVGDSIDVVKAAYGMPTDVRAYEASDAFVSVVYENAIGSLEFVIDDGNKVFAIMIDFAE